MYIVRYYTNGSEQKQMQEIEKQQIIFEAGKIKALADLMANANPGEVVLSGDSVIILGSQLIESVNKILGVIK